MKILFLKLRTLLAIGAILSCQSTVICQTDQGDLKPLVNGQTTDLKLFSGVFFSPAPGKYVELNDLAAPLISTGATVQSDGGIQVRILELKVYPAELFISELNDQHGEYEVKGFQISCRISISVSPDAEPGVKRIAIVLPGIDTVGRYTHSTPMRTDGAGIPTDLKLGGLEMGENVPRSKTLAVTLTTYRTAKELRIAGAKTHSMRDGILGAVGVLVGFLLLVAPVAMVIKEKSPFEPAVLWVFAIGFFCGVFFFIGGASKAHSVLTQYESELTWYQSIPFLTKALIALAYFSAAALLYRIVSDSWEWKQAAHDHTVISYRKYLHRGRWFSKHRKGAKEGIGQILNKAIAALCQLGIKQLVEHIGTGTSGAGTSIIVRVLDHIISNEQYLDPFPMFINYGSTYVSREEELARLYPHFKISTAKSAFTLKKNLARQGAITGLITEAFEKIVPEGVLVFVDEKPGRSFAEVHIKYAISTSGKLYYWVSQEQLPQIERDYFEGVSIQWLCQFLLNEEVADEFKLNSNPENVLTVMLSAGPEAVTATSGSIFDEMAASAFRDFKWALIRHFSLPVG
jgi:hypothetical protein